MPRRSRRSNLKAPSQRERAVTQLIPDSAKQSIFDEQSGATLFLDRYYGFGDAGSLAGSFDGYSSSTEALIDILEQYPRESLSTDPEQLGEVSICVLTARQYVERRRELED
jgi:hypothetical protein